MAKKRGGESEREREEEGGRGRKREDVCLFTFYPLPHFSQMSKFKKKED